MVYEIVIGETVGLSCYRWLIEAQTLLKAVEKAERKRKLNKSLYRGWVITSAKEIGELERSK